MSLAFHAPTLTGGKVLVIGDVMLDQYQTGIVERISPEAPVPIVKITEQTFRIGGAGNVAQNVATLGGQATLISLCGQDFYGHRLAGICAQTNIKNFIIPSATRETTLKTRIMATHQQMLRVDKETTRPLDDEEFASLTQAVASQMEAFETIILSDYGKGVISEKFLHWIMSRKSAKQKIILDPKTCNFSHYQGLFCMTPNAKEASEGIKMPVASHEDIIAAGKQIIARHHLRTLVITLGAQGMAVFLPGQGVYRLPTMAKKVFDVTGAGDTVIAVIALALSSEIDLLTSCLLANCAAGLVVGQVGAVGVRQEELATALSLVNADCHEKWSDL